MSSKVSSSSDELWPDNDSSSLPTEYEAGWPHIIGAQQHVAKLTMQHTEKCNKLFCPPTQAICQVLSTVSQLLSSIVDKEIKLPRHWASSTSISWHGMQYKQRVWLERLKWNLSFFKVALCPLSFFKVALWPFAQTFAHGVTLSAIKARLALTSAAPLNAVWISLDDV